MSSNYIVKGGENMRKRIIAVLMSMALSLTMVTPAFAQDVQPKVGTTVEETDATAEGGCENTSRR